MFDSEFFPTPKEVLDMMQVNCKDKIVLEPSAGKGDIVDYLKLNGAKSVLTYEKNKDLQQIVKSKSQLLGHNFFLCKSENISHVDLIVMNPPFSNADKHIMHAFEVAPQGCEIIALCNYQTINNSYSHSRKELIKLIENYGTETNLGSCFDNAERTTGIDIGLIKLVKPIVNADTEFEGFFMDDDEVQKQEDGIMPFNEVRALVQRYVGSMKIFDRLKDCIDELEYTTSAIGIKEFKLQVGYNDRVTTKEEFSKHLQKTSWNHIINITGIRKFTTSLMMQDINKFVEKQHEVKFTEKNVYHMLDMIIQTRGQQFDKALVASVDEFTKYVKENRFEVEGWVSNSSYMLNQKIIIPDLFERGWNNANYVTVRYGARYMEKLNDLVKVACTIIGYNHKDIGDIYQFKVDGERYLKTGIWYDWGFFEFKCFYKGTMHLKFKNKEDWYLINQAYGKLKGFNLPQKTK